MTAITAVIAFPSGQHGPLVLEPTIGRALVEDPDTLVAKMTVRQLADELVRAYYAGRAEALSPPPPSTPDGVSK